MTRLFSNLSQYEAQFLYWIQTSLRGPVTDPILSFFTHLGDHGLLFILLTVLLLLHPKTRRAGFSAACALVFSLLFTNLILKHLFARPRPWVDFGFLLPLVAEPDPNSFPSGHSSAAFAFALGAFPALPKRWMKVTTVAVAALMALSRLYVGVHYPSDVAAGILVGGLAALCGWRVTEIIAKRIRNRSA